MNLNAQVRNICKSSFCNVRNLAAIRNKLDKDTAKVAAHAFVTSMLDYGNALLYGLPKCRLAKLQLVQNSVARVVVNVRKYDRCSMTTIRRELHWLPINARIEFKILMLTWKAKNGCGPKYLTELLKNKTQSRNTRLQDDLLLEIPATKLVTCGDRAFEKCSPVLWNKLPLSIRKSETLNTFKSKLKTHLFAKCYLET